MLLNLRDVAGSCQNYDCKRGKEWKHKLKHLGIVLSQVCNSLHSFSLGGVLLKLCLFPPSHSNYPVVNPQCVKVLQFETQAVPNCSHPCQSFSATWSLEKTLLSYFLSKKPRGLLFSWNVLSEHMYSIKPLLVSQFIFWSASEPWIVVS